jgi:hypothetical protein
VILENFPV